MSDENITLERGGASDQRRKGWDRVKRRLGWARVKRMLQRGDKGNCVRSNCGVCLGTLGVGFLSKGVEGLGDSIVLAKSHANEGGKYK